MTIILLEFPSISEGDIEALRIFGADYLRDSEVWTGTPTTAEQTSSDLTLGTATLNGSAIVKDGVSHAANTVITVPVQGQLEATGEYAVKVTAATDATRTKNFLCKFGVDPST